MDIKFYEGEIKELLIAKVKSLGIEANEVTFDVSYGSIRTATVFCAEPKHEQATEE